MEQQAQLNTFIGGMNMDSDVSLLADNTYRYAENIRLLTDKDSSTGSLQNIDYIRLYNTGIPQNETILGTSSSRWFNDGKVEECGIVLTKYLKGSKTYNKLYVVSGFDSITPVNHLIMKGYLDIENNVSLVSNYESTEVSKVYITDGHSPIKVINILKPVADEIVDPTYFDIVPGAVLAPFKLKELVSGTLPACTILYCYLLFDVYGNETTTSSLSAKIPITVTSSSTKTTNGSLSKTVTDKGCRLQATAFNDGRFNRLRVISIQYLSSTDTPRIYIVSETDITSNPNGIITFEYTDTGSGYIKELTIEEFNDLVPFEFTSPVIEKKDNRLFAANIQEITWDVDYDARAYRANHNGSVRLESSYGDALVLSQSSIVNGPAGIIPKEHDCINPINGLMLYPEAKSGNDYSWDTIHTVRNNPILGGAGPNISYRFIYVDLTESEQNLNGNNYKYNLELNTSKETTTYVNVRLFDTGEVVKQIENTNEISRINNYADPYYVSNFLSYQRDETYRFGIIFYNIKNIPTPVHWIGDIRFPSADYGVKPFGSEFGKELMSRPIGILFNVLNMPSGAVAYEIVRCRRTAADRTVVTQGALSKTINFRGWKGPDEYNSEKSMGDIDRRPYVVPTFKNNPSISELDYTYTGSNVGSLPKRLYLVKENKDPDDKAGVFEFVSSDVCFNKTQNIVENGMYIVPLYYSYATFGKPNLLDPPIFGADLVNSQAVAINTYKGLDGIYKSGFGYICKSIEGSKFNGYTFIDGFLELKDKDKFISAGVVKLYNFDSASKCTNGSKYVRSSRIIEDAKVATNIPPAIAKGIEDVKNNYIDYIGNYAYTNWSIGTGHGPHGVTTILYSPEMYLNINGFAYSGANDSDLTSCCGSLIVNIKKRASQYGGNTYGGRLKSIYISANCYVKSDFGNYNSAVCFGGDTFLGVLDYTQTMLYNLNSFNVGNFDKRYCQVYIPLESSVNVYLRADKHFAQDTNPSGVPFEGGTANIMYMTEPGLLSTAYVLSMPMYTYNATYSNSNGSKKYIPKSMYAKDDMININRITCSDLKTNNELNDSWTKFRFANYLDVDSKYGKLTNLVNFNNKLYYFLDEAVGVASVNERSLITDNNASELVLGTGTILSRYDYMVVGNGSSIVNDKSILNSGTTLYWYDFDKNVICALNNNFMELSKSKFVLNYLNTLPKDAKTNAVSFYDKKYNEVWFRIYDKTLIFNELLNVFTSFYTHNPNWFFPFSDKLITIKDNNMYYLHNLYEVNSEIKEERISKIEFVVNKDSSNTKVFDNVSFDAYLLDKDNPNPKIITDVKFMTKTQNTDSINYNNIENREDNYRFYIPRETQPDPATQQLVNKSYAGRMRGKYMICDYTFDCNSGREMKIPYIKTTYRYSMV